MPAHMAIFFFLFFFLMLASRLTQTTQGEAGDPPEALRISCGSDKNMYTPVKNMLWLKDDYYSGGTAANVSVQSEISPKLGTLRYFQLSDGPENCYNISIPNGYYVVRVFFAFGPIDNSNREPLFDVSIEGTQVYSLKQGWSFETDLSYAECRVFVSDGSATVCFHSTGHGNPSVTSVEILQILDNSYDLGPEYSKDRVLRTMKRVSCGAKISGYGEDYNANLWGGDRFWATDINLDRGLSTSITITNPITGASISPNYFPEAIYQSASTASPMQSLSYNFEVEPNENYSIWLHFAEIFPDIKEEQRVFNVLVNDKILFKDVDIVKQAGGQYTALVINKTIAVNGRTLTLTFTPIKGRAIINAIEIYQVIRTEYTTVRQEVWALQVVKHSLGLPPRLGWNGDPCVPQEHPWSGVNCQFNYKDRIWFIEGLDLDNQGLKGFLIDDLASLTGLESMNFSGNSISGEIPSSFGKMSNLLYLDLSYNKLNGSIPESLGKLTQLRKLFLNGNQLSGEVPLALGAGPIHGTIFNFSENTGLCGIPGLPSCHIALSSRSVIGVTIGICLTTTLLALCCACWWKRRKNIARAQRISNPPNAPYAKSRTSLPRDVQLSRTSREPYVPHYMQQF